MFLKEKFTASGQYQRMKARLVAGGDKQNKELSEDFSSPTVSNDSVFFDTSYCCYSKA
jgi:hypothetical protein